MASADPRWVYAAFGVYTAKNQLDSDVGRAIFNLVTHQLVGPASEGFCVRGTRTALPGYTSVPPAVLVDFHLSPCGAPAPTTPSSPGTQLSAKALAPFVGSWGAHESGLTVDARGTGRLSYADLTKCPSCSFANAPFGSLVFVLKAMKNGAATGTVTASSDAKNWTVGQPVSATVSAASPGEFLNLMIGGAQITFCNSKAEGQCGA